jgi:hypothetical protein
MTESKAHVASLIDKAAKSDDADKAMKFAQAALNAANAIIGLSNMNGGEK